MPNEPRRLPAEWEPQSAVMLTWPHADSDWGPLLAQVEPVFVAIAAAVTRFQDLLISTRDEALRGHVADLLRAAGVPEHRCHLHCAPADDTWARDHGPLTVLRHDQPALLDFRFNGWGGKFPSRQDDALTARLHQAGAFGATPLESVDMVLEGGAVESDGQGTLMATRSAMVTATRNPGLDTRAVEERLSALLGIGRFLWLDHGHLEGDDTDGHIDTLARFCDAATIAYVACDDPQDPHYEPLQAMAAELASFRRADGRRYRLVPLPWPRAVYNDEGRRLPATYANFLIINGAVLVPLYSQPGDQAALEILQGCFPQRQVIGIQCSPLIQQYGSLHCVTMQLPEGVIGANRP